MNSGESPMNSRYAAMTSPEHGPDNARVVLVPLGAVEQHGAHLPVGTDIWIATAVCDLVAAGRDEVVVAEPLPVGVSGHHVSFPGTTTLRPSTFIALVVDVATSLARDGDVPVFVNGHGGNRGPLTVALQELVTAGVQAWALTYFEELSDIVGDAFPRPATAAGHAGAMETSIVAYLWPNLLRADDIPGPTALGAWPDPFLFPADRVQNTRRFEDIDPSGVVGEPKAYSAEAGQRLVAAAVDRIGGIIDRIGATR